MSAGPPFVWCTCLCAHVRVRVRVRACVRACMRVCVRATLPAAPEGHPGVRLCGPGNFGAGVRGRGVVPLCCPDGPCGFASSGPELTRVGTCACARQGRNGWGCWCGTTGREKGGGGGVDREIAAFVERSVGLGCGGAEGRVCGPCWRDVGARTPCIPRVCRLLFIGCGVAPVRVPSVRLGVSAVMPRVGWAKSVAPADRHTRRGGRAAHRAAVASAPLLARTIDGLETYVVVPRQVGPGLGLGWGLGGAKGVCALGLPPPHNEWQGRGGLGGLGLSRPAPPGLRRGPAAPSPPPRRPPSVYSTSFHFWGGRAGFFLRVAVHREGVRAPGGTVLPASLMLRQLATVHPHPAVPVNALSSCVFASPGCAGHVEAWA